MTNTLLLLLICLSVTFSWNFFHKQYRNILFRESSNHRQKYHFPKRIVKNPRDTSLTYQLSTADNYPIARPNIELYEPFDMKYNDVKSDYNQTLHLINNIYDSDLISSTNDDVTYYIIYQLLNLINHYNTSTIPRDEMKTKRLSLSLFYSIIKMKSNAFISLIFNQIIFEYHIHLNENDVIELYDHICSLLSFEDAIKFFDYSWNKLHHRYHAIFQIYLKYYSNYHQIKEILKRMIFYGYDIVQKNGSVLFLRTAFKNKWSNIDDDYSNSYFSDEDLNMSIEEFLHLFELSKELNFQLNEETYYHMMRILHERGYYSMSINFLYELIANNIQPKMYHYKTALKSCVRDDNEWDRIDQIHAGIRNEKDFDIHYENILNSLLYEYRNKMNLNRHNSTLKDYIFHLNSPKKSYLTISHNNITGDSSAVENKLNPTLQLQDIYCDRMISLLEKWGSRQIQRNNAYNVSDIPYVIVMDTCEYFGHYTEILEIYRMLVYRQIPLSHRSIRYAIKAAYVLNDIELLYDLCVQAYNPTSALKPLIHDLVFGFMERMKRYDLCIELLRLILSTSRQLEHGLIKRMVSNALQSKLAHENQARKKSGPIYEAFAFSELSTDIQNELLQFTGGEGSNSELALEELMEVIENDQEYDGGEQFLKADDEGGSAYVDIEEMSDNDDEVDESNINTNQKKKSVLHDLISSSSVRNITMESFHSQSDQLTEFIDSTPPKDHDLLHVLKIIIVDMNLFLRSPLYIEAYRFVYQKKDYMTLRFLLKQTFLSRDSHMLSPKLYELALKNFIVDNQPIQRSGDMILTIIDDISRYGPKSLAFNLTENALSRLFTLFTAMKNQKQEQPAVEMPNDDAETNLIIGDENKSQRRDDKTLMITAMDLTRRNQMHIANLMYKILIQAHSHFGHSLPPLVYLLPVLACRDLKMSDLVYEIYEIAKANKNLDLYLQTIIDSVAIDIQSPSS